MKRLLKRLSLQWRITLLTILLLATACVTMKTLLCSSGHAYMDSIGNYVMHYVQEDPQAVRVDISDEQWKDLSERFNGEFVLELSGAKHSFCIRGWYIALAVTVLGGALYHLIFEAKAQYAYPYMVYMLPLAAAGLCRLEDGTARLICSGKKWVQRRAECARTSHRD